MSRAMDILKLCIISTALDVTEGIFAVLYVSIMGLTRFYKTTVFLHLFNKKAEKFENVKVVVNRKY